MADEKEHNSGHSHPHHQSATAGLDNWRNSDLPFSGKLKKLLGNNWIKVRKRQTCCGHPGEPGC
jgi:hypothetical protein